MNKKKMVMGAALFLLGVLMLLYAIFGYGEKTVPPSSPVTAPSSPSQSAVEPTPPPGYITTETVEMDTRRKKVFASYSEAFRNLAARSSNPEVKAVYNFLVQHEMAATLRGNSLSLFEKKKPNRVAVLTVLPEDPAEVQSLLREEAGARFVDETQMVCLREKLVSKFSAVLAYGHEWYHAYDYDKRGYSWPEGYYESGEGELNAYNFQLLLQSEVGGSAYEAWVNRKCESVADEAQLHQGEAGYVLKAGDYDPELDKILGPSVSDFDRETRQKQCWRAAVWRMYDRYLVGDPKQAKLDFIRDR
ncbi:MAG TPA: hypothetical protein VGE59_04865 [Patescibacteria group bacterium]